MLERNQHTHSKDDEEEQEDGHQILMNEQHTIGV
jgi:hypothetical protein